MKTKYIKVSVSNRLPKYNMHVILIDRFNNTFEGHISEDKNWIIYTDGEFDKVEYWLQEVPDYEEEMKEMLEKILKINAHHNFNGHLINNQIEELLTKLKTES